MIDAFEGATVLLISGVLEAVAFSMPPRTDCLTLPALVKATDGHYHARRLDVQSQTLLRLRAQTIKAAIESFQPDVLLVDKLPRGVARELDPALNSISAGGRTRCVLGLRDVLDDPLAVRREWQAEDNERVIAELYDAVWVYGDPHVYDTVREYGFNPEIVRKTSYTGYLERSPLVSEMTEAGVSRVIAAAERRRERIAMCMVGGGEDGSALAETFAAAPRPSGMCGVILAGPFMPRPTVERLCQRVRRDRGLHVLEFVRNPWPLLSRADRVVTMGGYNAVSEVLAAHKPALIVPRVAPRREQWIRAQRLRELGLVDVLPPEHLTSTELSRWLWRSDLEAASLTSVDFGGLRRLPRLLAELLPPRGSDAALAISGEGSRSYVFG